MPIDDTNYVLLRRDLLDASAVVHSGPADDAESALSSAAKYVSMHVGYVQVMGTLEIRTTDHVLLGVSGISNVAYLALANEDEQVQWLEGCDYSDENGRLVALREELGVETVTIESVIDAARDAREIPVDADSANDDQ